MQEMNNNRTNAREYYLQLARCVASRSTCLHKQYGAIIVKDGEIVSSASNGAMNGEASCYDAGACKKRQNDGKCVAVHAEQNALILGSREEMKGATLYLYGMENGRTITAKPCDICNRMIRNAGIRQVVISTKEDK